MVDDKPDDIGPQADLDRPKRAPRRSTSMPSKSRTKPSTSARPMLRTSQPARGHGRWRRSCPPRSFQPFSAPAPPGSWFGSCGAKLLRRRRAPQVNNAAIDALAARVAGIESKAAAPRRRSTRLRSMRLPRGSPASNPRRPRPRLPLRRPGQTRSGADGEARRTRENGGVAARRTRRSAHPITAAFGGDRGRQIGAARNGCAAGPLAINERLAKIEAAARTLSPRPRGAMPRRWTIRN